MTPVITEIAIKKILFVKDFFYFYLINNNNFKKIYCEILFGFCTSMFERNCLLHLKLNIYKRKEKKFQVFSNTIEFTKQLTNKIKFERRLIRRDSILSNVYANVYSRIKKKILYNHKKSSISMQKKKYVNEKMRMQKMYLKKCWWWKYKQKCAKCCIIENTCNLWIC